MPTRVLIVADLPGLRADLRTALELSPDILVAGAVAPTDLPGPGTALPADVALVDLDSPDLEGFRAAHRLKTLGLARAVVALSARSYPAAREAAARAGADAFLVKGADLPVVLETIRRCRNLTGLNETGSK